MFLSKNINIINKYMRISDIRVSRDDSSFSLLIFRTMSEFSLQKSPGKDGVHMDMMSIASLSMAMSAGSLQNDVSIAVLDKAMDTFEMAGEGLVELINTAPSSSTMQPGLGQNIDISI